MPNAIAQHGVEKQACCAVCAEDAPETIQWLKDGHEIVRCSNCGLLFRRFLPDPQEIDAIYRENYFRDDGELSEGTGYRDYLADEAQHRLTAQHRLKKLYRLIQPPGNLFDIGCAAGFFLDEARKSGWDSSGIDIAEAMTNHATARLGLKVSTGLFQSIDLPQEHFDCVTMWDYIEHSFSPCEDFRKAYALLRPGGTLTLSTGDASSVLARLSGKRWHLLTPNHHNFFFTAKTLRRSLWDAGFTVVDVSYPPAWYSLSYLFHKLRTMMPGKAMSAIVNLLERLRIGKLSVPVNLFDIVTITAVRR